MLTAKLFLLAAIATVVAATDNTVHVHIKVHHTPSAQNLRQAKPQNDSICLPGYTTVSVEGLPGGFCTKREICQGSKDNKGNCPGPMAGLENGSSCVKVKSGAYGCKANDKPPAAPPSTPNKPPPPPATPNKPVPPPANPHKPTPPPAAPSKPANGKCDPGMTLVSVEGLSGGFCSKRDICQGKDSKGFCPGPQEGLQFGSYCTTIKSGAYGCKAKSSKSHRKNNAHKKH